MHLLVLAVSLVVAATAVADDYRPPIPKGIGGETILQSRPIPLPAADRRWVTVQSRHFNIISSASERTTRDAADKLERLTSALGQVHEKFAIQPDGTRVFLFAHRSDCQAYFDLLLNKDRAPAPGVFVTTGSGEGHMIVDASRAWSDRTIFHELIHNLLARSGARLPLWLEEGLAEYFSSAEIRGSVIRVGGPLVGHQRTVRARGLIPLETLFAVPRNSEVGTKSIFYAESWAVIDWMMRNRRKQFYSFVADVENGVSAADALRKHFGVDPILIERMIKRQPLQPAAWVSLPVRERHDEITVVPIARAEALYELGKFLGDLDVSQDAAERYLEAAAKEDPSFGRAKAALATLSSRRKEYEKAGPLFEAALKTSPNDPVVHLEYAESLLRNALGPFAGVTQLGGDDVPRFRKARLMAQTAIAIGGHRGRADSIIGASFLVEDDVRPGIEALERARAAFPARTDIALNLYALYLRGDDHPRADALFDDVFSRSRNPQTTLAARAVFVREKLTRANRLIAQQRLDEAVALIRGLIDVTPDSNARADLQRQIEKLEEVAMVNRHINSYNAAVAAANRGDNESALRLLEDLLAVASDAKVIRDATALRSGVRSSVRRKSSNW